MGDEERTHDLLANDGRLGRCFARSCPVLVRRPLLSCRRHWGLVADELQQRIGAAVLAKDLAELTSALGLARARIVKREERLARRKKKRPDTDGGDEA